MSTAANTARLEDISGHDNNNKNLGEGREENSQRSSRHNNTEEHGGCASETALLQQQAQFQQLHAGLTSFTAPPPALLCIDTINGGSSVVTIQGETSPVPNALLVNKISSIGANKCKIPSSGTPRHLKENQMLLALTPSAATALVTIPGRAVAIPGTIPSGEADDDLSGDGNGVSGGGGGDTVGVSAGARAGAETEAGTGGLSSESMSIAGQAGANTAAAATEVEAEVEYSIYDTLPSFVAAAEALVDIEGRMEQQQRQEQLHREKQQQKQQKQQQQRH
jgi:hypothetical protein